MKRAASCRAPFFICCPNAEGRRLVHTSVGATQAGVLVGGAERRWGGGLLFAAFEEEGEDDLVEALCDVDGDVVDAVLHGALLEVGLLA